MKRAGGIWPEVVAYGNLERAARRAALGKRTRPGVARFLDRLEPELLRVQRRLDAGAWRPGRPTRFRIFDPKERTITAPAFEDRVVHHALLGPLEPVFERRMVFESFACRRGKGTRAALRHAQRLLRRFGECATFDVADFFGSLDHDVVLETFVRIVKDRRVTALFERIIRAGDGSGAPAGLPLGSLTSQWSANLVLDRLDHFVKERLRVPGYVRYMDDFVLFADRRDDLRRWTGEVGAFLLGLRLRLKEKALRLLPAHAGLPYLGWRIYRGTTRLRPQNMRRTRRRLRGRAAALAAGRIGESAYADSVRSVADHLRLGGAGGLRRRWFFDTNGRGLCPGA